MRVGTGILIFSLILNGCTYVGIAAIGNRSSRVAYPNISRVDKCISEEIFEFAPTTSNELLKFWGNPDNLKIVGLDYVGSYNESWRYNFGRRWNGVVIGLIIPIPIVIPVGKDYIEFHVQDGEVISAFMKDDSGVYGAMFVQNIFFDSGSNIEAESTIGYYDNVVLEKFRCKDADRMIGEE